MNHLACLGGYKVRHACEEKYKLYRKQFSYQFN